MTRVGEIREARGLRREDIASRAVISVDYVRKLESGDHVPGLEVARRVAAALGVTVDEAFPPATSADQVVA